MDREILRKGREVGRSPETDVGDNSTGVICCSDVGSLNQGSLSLGRPVKERLFFGHRRRVGRKKESEITPGLRQRGRQVDSTAAKQKHRAERLCTVKAESTTCDSPQLVVGAMFVVYATRTSGATNIALHIGLIDRDVSYLFSGRLAPQDLVSV